MKKYENPEIGIAFEHPADWVSIDCKLKDGIDVYMHKDFTNFGIVKISEGVRSDIINRTQALQEILVSSVQQNEVLIGDVGDGNGIQLNKYETPNLPSQSVTMMLHKPDSQIGNIVHERTLLINNCNNDDYDDTDRIFILAFEDLPENYESGKSQLQLKRIFNSIRFIQ